MSTGTISGAKLRRVLQANTLLADHIFSPSLLLAERIERGLLPVSGKNGEGYCLIAPLRRGLIDFRPVIELGAGYAAARTLRSSGSG